MIRGLYTAATALEQNSKRLDVIANNLANVKTTGFKKDNAISEEFASTLLLKTGGESKTLLDRNARVEFEKEGEVYRTNTKRGFFRVMGEGGISHNTSLAFKVDSQGYLRTPYNNSDRELTDEFGYKVLDSSGNPIRLDAKKLKITDGIVNSEALDIKIDKAGNLTANSVKIANLLFHQSINVIGTMSGGSKLNRVFTDYEQGSFEATESPLDLALAGEGFFTIITPQGDRYSRNGQFKLNDEGVLMTSEGHPVKGVNGEIVLKGANIGFNELGEVILDGQIVDKLQLIVPNKIQNLLKEGTNLYRYNGKMEDMGFKGKVVQGYLESSNVNSVTEMVKMMESFRNYETAQRILKSYDDIIGSAVNQIAKL